MKLKQWKTLVHPHMTRKELAEYNHSLVGLNQFDRARLRALNRMNRQERKAK